MVVADAAQRRYANTFRITFDLAVDPVNPRDIVTGQHLGDRAAAFQFAMTQQVKPIAETRGQA